MVVSEAYSDPIERLLAEGCGRTAADKGRFPEAITTFFTQSQILEKLGPELALQEVAKLSLALDVSPTVLARNLRLRDVDPVTDVKQFYASTMAEGDITFNQARGAQNTKIADAVNAALSAREKPPLSFEDIVETFEAHEHAFEKANPLGRAKMRYAQAEAELENICHNWPKHKKRLASGASLSISEKIPPAIEKFFDSLVDLNAMAEGGKRQ